MDGADDREDETGRDLKYPAPPLKKPQDEVKLVYIAYIAAYLLSAAVAFRHEVV